MKSSSSQETQRLLLVRVNITEWLFIWNAVSHVKTWTSHDLGNTQKHEDLHDAEMLKIDFIFSRQVLISVFQ